MYLGEDVMDQIFTIPKSFPIVPSSYAQHIRHKS